MDSSVQHDKTLVVVRAAEDGDLRCSILGKQKAGEVTWVETRKAKRVKTADLEEIKSTVSEAGTANSTVSEVVFRGKHSFNYHFFMRQKKLLH